MAFKQLKLRRATAANWTTDNPTLAAAEIGVETDTLLFKIGDGSTAWTSLAYAAVTTGSINGTANQITVTPSGSSVTLSTPQDLDTGCDWECGTLDVAGAVEVGGDILPDTDDSFDLGALESAVEQIAYDTGDDVGEEVSGATTGIGQTFTTSGGFTLSKVSLLLYRANSPGTITFELYATSAGLPTGSALATGSTDGDTLTDSSSGEWRDIELDTPYALSGSTQYALVIWALSGGGANDVFWRADQTSPAYGGGTYVYTTNGGSSWSSSAAVDLMFRTYSGSDISQSFQDFYLSGDIKDGTNAWSVADVQEVLDWTDQDVQTSASPTFNDLTISTPSNIYGLSHDSFADYDVNEHVAHNSVSIIAGTGLTGGGTIDSDVTLDCSITQYTDELAQDAVGSIFVNTSTIEFTYDDPTPQITADLNATLKLNYDAAYTHISSNGTDHGYIDQDVQTSGSPQFANLTLTGNLTIPDGGTIGSASDSDAIKISNTGDVGIECTPACKLDVSDTIRSQAYTAPTSGKGIEIGYHTPTNAGYVSVHDRDGSTYKPLILRGSEVSLFYEGTEKLEVASGGVTIKDSLTIQDNGANFNLAGLSAVTLAIGEFSAQSTNKGVAFHFIPNGTATDSYFRMVNDSDRSNYSFCGYNVDGADAAIGPRDIGSPSTSVANLRIGGATNHNAWTTVGIDATNTHIGDGGDTDYVDIDNSGHLTFVGDARLYPRVLNQSTEPGAGTGATQCDSGELVVWTDTDDSKCYLCYNHGGTVKTVELV